MRKNPPSPDLRRHLLRNLGILPLLPFIPACQPSEPLTIASHVWPGYELMFLARSEGWLPDGTVRLFETTSATRSMLALREGRAHGAALTLDEVLMMRAEGIPLTVVLVFDASAGADVVISRTALRELRDLRGKSIGAETTALGALMLTRLLEKAGLQRSDVDIVSITSDDHLQAWRSGKLDALITYEPTASRLLGEGAHRLLDSRQFPESIFDVLAVRPDVAQRQSTALRSLIAGHFKGLRQLRQNPQDTAYRLAGRLNLAGDQALQAFRGLHLPGLPQNRALLAGNGRLHQVGAELSGIMHRSGLLNRPDTLEGLISDHYLPENEGA